MVVSLVDAYLLGFPRIFAIKKSLYLRLDATHNNFIFGIECHFKFLKVNPQIDF